MTPVNDGPRGGLPLSRRHRGLHERLHEQDGAVVVIVVLSIIALFGMIVLVVDVGGMLHRRVAVQNSADAAALAAAISCANNEGLLEANAQADYYASVNSDSAVVATGYPSYFPSCSAPAGRVKVRVTVQQPLFFAGVFGAGDETPVTTEAVASWGGALASEHIAPLMLSADRLRDCNIPPRNPGDWPPPGEGLECAFFWDNSPASVSNPILASSEWGTLDLLKWDVEPSVGCDNSTPPQFAEWMFEGYSGYLGINSGDPDPPTYVCRGQGNFGNALDKLIDDAIDFGLDPDDPLYLYFPVNDPRNQIDRDGNPCPPPDLIPGYEGCTVDKYDIIGFARLRIDALYKKQDPEIVSECTSRITIGDPPVEVTPTANSRCMIATWLEYTNEGLTGDEQTGENFGIVPVALIE